LEALKCGLLRGIFQPRPVPAAQLERPGFNALR
jgi:hypothetical protein